MCLPEGGAVSEAGEILGSRLVCDCQSAGPYPRPVCIWVHDANVSAKVWARFHAVCHAWRDKCMVRLMLPFFPCCPLGVFSCSNTFPLVFS